MIRILHTSDWHLGHSLRGFSRYYEHQKFLKWLLSMLKQQAIDALLVAGDMFDSANPSAESQQLFYQFLVNAKQQQPNLDIIIIAGNHDSANRLDAPESLLKQLNINVVGQAKKKSEQLILPLTDNKGHIKAWCVAVPFLRPTDLAEIEDESLDPLVEGVRKFYADLLTQAKKQCQADQAIIAMGHCYMSGGQSSEGSERKILGGNQHALPVDIFAQDLTDLAYVALGHLHKPQEVAGFEHIRYSGSPLPLSVVEADYPHQVVIVDIDNADVSNINSQRIPRAVDMIRLPKKGEATWEQLLLLLSKLPVNQGQDKATWAYLDIHIRLTQPQPQLAQLIEQQLDDKAVRLLRIHPYYQGKQQSLAQVQAELNLEDLKPEQVFEHCYQQQYDQFPSEALHKTFLQLLSECQQGMD